MLRSLVWAAPLALGLVALSPHAALSQDRPRFAIGAGVDGVPLLDGQHLFAAVLVPLPIERVTGRIEALLHHGGRESGSLALTGNLRAALLRGHPVVPYLIGGGGLALSNSGGLAASLGIGAEMPARPRPWFLEMRLHALGGFDAPGNGFVSVGIGTTF